MMVCAHGNVTEYCKDRDMVICEVWDGDIREYKGDCRVLVTDSDISEQEYYFLKGELLGKGVELISTRYKDNELLSEFLAYSVKRRRVHYRGRRPYDAVVVQRIKELQSSGMTLRAIRDDDIVRRYDGKKLSISTIARILKESE